jgi:hypothetical protein
MVPRLRVASAVDDVVPPSSPSTPSSRLQGLQMASQIGQDRCGCGIALYVSSLHWHQCDLGLVGYIFHVLHRFVLERIFRRPDGSYKQGGVFVDIGAHDGG